MLHRVIGRAGSGKTTYLLAVLREALQNGADCIVLVPEQQSLETERLLSETLGDGYNMHCEVLNFERLPNRVAREYGGLARTYIDDSGRDLLMSVVLERLSPQFTEYGGVCADGDFIRKAAVGKAVSFDPAVCGLPVQLKRVHVDPAEAVAADIRLGVGGACAYVLAEQARFGRRRRQKRFAPIVLCGQRADGQRIRRQQQRQQPSNTADCFFHSFSSPVPPDGVRPHRHQSSNTGKEYHVYKHKAILFYIFIIFLRKRTKPSAGMQDPRTALCCIRRIGVFGVFGIFGG